MKNRKDYLKLLFLISLSVCLMFFINEHYIKADKKNPVISSTEPAVTPKKKTKTSDLPISAQLDVPLLYQFDEPSLYNGCEVTSLAMLIQFYGSTVTKNELADNLVSVPLMDDDGYMGNPNQAFVGDVSGNDSPGLGVYHGPIANLAKEYVGNENVFDSTGSDFTDVMAQVAAGNPVWIITTATFAPVDDFVTWETTTGKIDVTYSMHSVVVTGYDAESIYFNDPYGEKDASMDKENFIAAFEQMGSQAISLFNN